MTGVSFGGSIENRLSALIELSRRAHPASDKKEAEYPTITLSREFGCEGMLVAEKTQALLREMTGEEFVIMDRGIIDKVTSDRDLADEILTNFGEKNAFMDGVISTIFNKDSDKEQYQRLCKQIVPFARKGRIIMVGVGAGIIAQNLPNCHKFRLIAPMDFKVKGVSRRHGIPEPEAEKLIAKRQKLRNDFIRDFLGKDITDVSLYDVIFNNAVNSAQQIAELICHRVVSARKF
jgi:cytidylate kinase